MPLDDGYRSMVDGLTDCMHAARHANIDGVVAAPVLDELAETPCEARARRQRYFHPYNSRVPAGRTSRPNTTCSAELRLPP